MISEDLFGQALGQWTPERPVVIEFQRDDKRIDEHDLAGYFSDYADFSDMEKRALEHVRGKALDVGCGAGRHSLYLQSQGIAVSAIDLSPAAVALAKRRGVVDVRMTSACEPLPFERNAIDTVLMMGNNFGICGDFPNVRAMLKEFNRITRDTGRLIVHSVAPATTKPEHLSYLKWNLKRGRTPGLVTLRVVYQDQKGPWFDLLFIAPSELLSLAWDMGWEMNRVYSSGDLERGYIAVLDKR